MLSIGNDQGAKTPVVTYGLALFLFCCYWVQWLLHDATLSRLTLTGIGFPALFTHLFLHAHIGHLIWNLGLLYIFGGLVERKLGRTWLALGFLGFGLAAGLCHAILDGRPAMGASGAISGLVGLMTGYAPRTRLTLFTDKLTIPFFSLSILWVLKDLVLLAIPSFHTATAGHLGGFIVGILTGVGWRFVGGQQETNYA